MVTRTDIICAIQANVGDQVVAIPGFRSFDVQKIHGVGPRAILTIGEGANPIAALDAFKRLVGEYLPRTVLPRVEIARGAR